ncbi:MAG: phosphatase PAP2 family protein [Bacilli bacterium]|jgi:undecaprenyl-diphosphatase|nr:phosphatase PAP2 family protein [Bacilli bacterium]
MDIEVSLWFSEHHDKVLNIFFSLLSLLGEGMFIWIILLLIVLYNKKEWFYLKIIPFMCIGGWLIVDLLIKNLVRRERPYVQLNLEAIGYLIPHSYSFPSGHSFSSFLAATILTYLKPKYSILFYLLAFLIALSRVYCLVHFTSDVIVGAILGILWGLLTILIMKKVFQKELWYNNLAKRGKENVK